MSGGVIHCRPQSHRKDNARPRARSVTMSLSRTVMDEKSSSEESRDVDELATNRAFHSFHRKGEREDSERGGGFRMLFQGSNNCQDSLGSGWT